MIAIIDYGMGNLRSVQKGFEYVGYAAEVTKEPQRLLAADKVVLPGVGAFSDAMDSLKALGLIPVIEQIAAAGKPLMGICLGMQLLLDKSHEGGIFEGLGLIPGEVCRIIKSSGIKVPHMGWNELKNRNSVLFAELRPKANVYFVHSYHVMTEEAYVIGTTDYGSPITAAIAKGQVYGLQFHPEKSGEPGLQILRNFGGL